MFNSALRKYLLSCVITNILVLIPVLCVAKFVHLNADDLVYSFVSPIDNLVNNYFHWAGAYTSMFFSPLIGGILLPIFYKIAIFCLFLSIALSLFLFILHNVFSINYKLLIALNLIVQMCFWYFHPSLSSGFFIVNWFVAYTFALGFVLINNFLFSQISVNSHNSKIKFILSIILSFIICGDSLTVVVPYILMVVLWLIFTRSDYKMKRLMIYILVANLFFVFINVAAPGNFERAKYAAMAAPFVDRINTGFLGYLSFALRLFDDKRFIIFLILGLIIPINIKNYSPKKFVICYVFLMLSLILDAILCIPTGESSGRLSNFAYYEIFLLFAIILINLHCVLPKISKKVVLSICLLGYLCFIPSYKKYVAPWYLIPTFAEEFVAQYRLLDGYQIEVDDRVNTIKSKSFDGYVNQINVPDIISAGVPPLFQNCEHWINKSMANIYKVEKVCLRDKNISSDNIIYMSPNEYFWILK